MAEYEGDKLSGICQLAAIFFLERRTASRRVIAKILNYLDVFGPAGAPLGQRTTSEGSTLWLDADRFI
jgi:hypothetical protein